MDIGKHMTFLAQGANSRVVIRFEAGMLLVSDLATRYKHKPITIMAVVDEYIMARKGKGFPFVYSQKLFVSTFLDSCGYKIIATIK